ncbi:hypothetical protein RRG08_020944 [Elysia crispata]|uniref:Uncharacterized protein n=1 Tax=Elysia crispata TaxID=231223 RepID=A0AAE1BCV8_9GAST|nr:hypothetical protein RRG08_020944 [Elysia crispata]
MEVRYTNMTHRIQQSDTLHKHRTQNSATRYLSQIPHTEVSTRLLQEIHDWTGRSTNQVRDFPTGVSSSLVQPTSRADRIPHSGN